ncbi:MAG: ATP-binding protein [Oscillatoria sp. Prado101]|jgi:PAS domain S-box-containing protein|nr:ATP-binding protein [Oscillatoria sp. Prado101]
MQTKKLFGIKGYSIAALTVLLALLLKLELGTVLEMKSPFILFFGAVIVSAWYGGFGPGVLASFLAASASNYFFLSPRYSLEIGNFGQTLNLGLFVLEGLLVSWTIAALKSATEKAEKQQEILRQTQEIGNFLVNSLKDCAIFTLNPEGRSVSWNAGSEMIMGYGSEEIIDQHFSCFYLAEDIELGKPDQLLSAAAAEGRAEEEGWRLRKDGSQLWAYMAIAALRDEAGNLRGFSCVIRDLTERKEAVEALQLQREQLAQANRLKDEFLAVVSHELRSPLNAILGWTQTIRRKQSDAAVLKALEIIERNGKLQLQLIDDLLDLSSIIQGKLRMRTRLLDLEPIINAAIDAIRPAAEAKSIQVESAVDLYAGKVIGDQDRLLQIFWNLLSNAVKFTPEGGQVLIQIQGVISHVEISVSDTGCGINADFLPYVFDRFSQSNPTGKRGNGGLGLGLAIVRHLAELHGGTVRAASQGVGRGATFTVELPVAAIAIKPSDTDWQQKGLSVGSPVPAGSKKVLQGLRLLVVDNRADTCKLIADVLETFGAQVTVALSAGEALHLLEKFKPDVLMSDIEMPEEDGYHLIRRVRDMEAALGGKIPAIALTGHSKPEAKIQAFSAGFQMYLSKPAEPDELAAMVASIAKLGRN